MITYRRLTVAEALEVFAEDSEEKKMIEHPFSFKRAHFLAFNGSRKVGRISANLSIRAPHRGYFGFFKVCPEEPALAEACALGLFRNAENWLTREGAREVIGPVNYTTLFDYRFRTDLSHFKENEPRFFWEPDQPSIYLEWLKKSGYRLLQEYHSRAYGNTRSVLPVSEKRYRELSELGFSTRPIRIDGPRSTDLKILFKINSLSFQDSFLSEPFDLDAYLSLNVPRFKSLLSEFSFFILSPSMEEIGYFFLFEDQGYLVWKTLAILPEYQKTGLAGFGIHHALTLAHNRGLDRVISALIRKGAPSEALLEKAAPLQIWEHRYGVFSKEVLPGAS